MRSAECMSDREGIITHILSEICPNVYLGKGYKSLSASKSHYTPSLASAEYIHK